MNLGFNAIWISPVVENTENGFHGYWAKNWDNLNPYFGTADQLKKLVDAAHELDVYVMVDVVANHVGPIGDDFTQITPFNSASDYHEDCEITDWSN